MASPKRHSAFVVHDASRAGAPSFHVQKKGRIASERDEAKRKAFWDEIEKLDPDDLVFLDEAGVSLAMSVLRGWGRKGDLLIEAVTAKRGKNLSVLGAFDRIGMLATTCKLGAMTREDFETFIRIDLLPKLEPGSVLIFDNATIHKGGKIEAIVKKGGCRLLYLPSYSPDFNPIELAWAFLKRIIRKRGPRNDDARKKAVEDALAAIPDLFADACFRHCNYLPKL